MRLPVERLDASERRATVARAEFDAHRFGVPEPDDRGVVLE